MKFNLVDELVNFGEKSLALFPHSFKNQAYSHGLSYYFQFMGPFLCSIPNFMRTERDRKIFVP